MANAILVSNSCGGRSSAALARGITSEATAAKAFSAAFSLVFLFVRKHFLQNVFSLGNLRTIFEAVCLLYEKHVSMVLRCFHDFWTRTPIFNIYSEALIR
jgi:hypothetical protein